MLSFFPDTVLPRAPRDALPSDSARRVVAAGAMIAEGCTLSWIRRNAGGGVQRESSCLEIRDLLSAG
jgi:hypothetical protein